MLGAVLLLTIQQWCGGRDGAGAGLEAGEVDHTEGHSTVKGPHWLSFRIKVKPEECEQGERGPGQGH